MQNPRKVAVIGCGFVGASIAFSLMQKGLFSELVLIDSNTAKAHGEAMDLSHGLPYTASMDIYAGSYDDIADSALIIITAGAAARKFLLTQSKISGKLCLLRQGRSMPILSWCGGAARRYIL